MEAHKLQGGGTVFSQAAPIQGPTPLQVPQTTFATFQAGQLAQQRATQQVSLLQARQASEQRADEARRRSLLDLKGQFGIAVHNPAQQKVLDQVMSDSGIRPEDMKLLDLNNPYQVKDLENRFATAASDSRFLRVVGEVEAANRLRLMAHNRLNADEIQKWESEGWRQYTQLDDPETGFNINKLSAAFYKTPPPEKRVDLRTTTQATRKSFDKIDVNSPEEIEALADGMTLDLLSKNPEAAIEQGLLEIGDDGRPRVSQAALNDALTRIKIAQREEDEDPFSEPAERALARELFADGRAQTPGEARRMATRILAEERRQVIVNNPLPSRQSSRGSTDEKIKERFGDDVAGRYAAGLAADLDAAGFDTEALRLDTRLINIGKINSKGENGESIADQRRDATIDIVRANIRSTKIDDVSKLNGLLAVLGEPQIIASDLRSREGIMGQVLQILTDKDGLALPKAVASGIVFDVFLDLDGDEGSGEPAEDDDPLDSFLEFERN